MSAGDKTPAAALRRHRWYRYGDQRQRTAGAGLSSSASLEVAVGQALQAAYQLPLDGVALALNGRGGKPLRRLQLWHHGSADLRPWTGAARPVDRLPRPDHPRGAAAAGGRGGDHQLQRQARTGRQRIQHPPPAVRSGSAILWRRRLARRHPAALRRRVPRASGADRPPRAT